MQAGYDGANRDVNFWLRVKNDPANVNAFRTLGTQIQQQQTTINQAMATAQNQLSINLQNTTKKSLADMQTFVSSFKNQLASMMAAWNQTVATMNANQPRLNGGGGGGGSGGGATRIGGGGGGGIENTPILRLGQAGHEILGGAALLSSAFGAEDTSRAIMQTGATIWGTQQIGRGALRAYQTGGAVVAAANADLAAAGSTLTVGAIAPPAAAAIAAALAAALLSAGMINDAYKGQALGTTSGGYLQAGAQSLKGYTPEFMRKGVFGQTLTMGFFDAFTSDDSGVVAGQKKAEDLRRQEAIRKSHADAAIGLNELQYARDAAIDSRSMVGFDRQKVETRSRMLGAQAQTLGGRLNDATAFEGRLGANANEEQRAQASQRVLEIMAGQKRNLEDQLKISKEQTQQQIKGAREALSIYEDQRETLRQQIAESRNEVKQGAMAFADMTTEERNAAIRAKEKLAAGADLTAKEQSALDALGGEQSRAVDKFRFDKGMRLGFGATFGKEAEANAAQADKQFQDTLQKIADNTMNIASIERNAEKVATTINQKIDVIADAIFERVINRLNLEIKNKPRPNAGVVR